MAKSARRLPREENSPDYGEDIKALNNKLDTMKTSFDEQIQKVQTTTAQATAILPQLEELRHMAENLRSLFNEERRLRERFWSERLIYFTALIGSWVITTVSLAKLYGWI
jgi:cell shape-determining protein MreC